MSTEKVIVVDAAADEVAAESVKRAKSLSAGRPGEPVHLASGSDRDSIDHVARFVDDALSKGARLLAGGERECGTILAATVVDEGTAEIAICSAENLGSMPTRFRARNEDQAIEIANDTKHGLAGSACTRDLRRGLEVARRMQTGIGHVSGPKVGDAAEMPFGGTKASSNGRFGGSAAIDAFTELRWISTGDPDQHGPV